MRIAIEAAIPHGGPGVKGSWEERGYRKPKLVAESWRNGYPGGKSLHDRYRDILEKHPRASSQMSEAQVGSLGSGNHFVEVCLDSDGAVWFMLHSGSRGPGNKIGTYFIELAKRDMQTAHPDVKLADKNLAYLDEGTEHFKDYIEAVMWAQDYARANRTVMMTLLVDAVKRVLKRDFDAGVVAINCHHNYVQEETHFGDRVWLTRKGAVSARKDELGIIPGAMGRKSFIVRGKGNPESYHTCSHGAGRAMSRGEAKRTFTVKDHVIATEGLECRKDAGVLDETPACYKDIEAVMAAQSDLVDVVAELRAVLCVKG